MPWLGVPGLVGLRDPGTAARAGRGRPGLGREVASGDDQFAAFGSSERLEGGHAVDDRQHLLGTDRTAAQGPITLDLWFGDPVRLEATGFVSVLHGPGARTDAELVAHVVAVDYEDAVLADVDRGGGPGAVGALEGVGVTDHPQRVDPAVSRAACEYDHRDGIGKVELEHGVGVPTQPARPGSAQRIALALPLLAGHTHPPAGQPLTDPVGPFRGDGKLVAEQSWHRVMVEGHAGEPDDLDEVGGVQLGGPAVEPAHRDVLEERRGLQRYEVPATGLGPLDGDPAVLALQPAVPASEHDDVAVLHVRPYGVPATQHELVVDAGVPLDLLHKVRDRCQELLGLFRDRTGVARPFVDGHDVVVMACQRNNEPGGIVPPQPDHPDPHDDIIAGRIDVSDEEESAMLRGRNIVTRLIDVGMQEDFTLSASAVDTAIRAGSARTGNGRAAEVEIVRTRSLAIGAAALSEDATIIHVMAHGSNQPDEVGWWSDDDDTGWLLEDLYDHMEERDLGITAPVLISDSCNGGRARFTKGIQHLLYEPCLYIASPNVLSWSKAHAYAGCFYPAHTSLRTRISDPIERGEEAAERAADAYCRLMDVPDCPMTATRLDPILAD